MSIEGEKVRTILATGMAFYIELYIAVALGCRGTL
jgi:hypothetical protein